jgi:hypothetical protein
MVVASLRLAPVKLHPMRGTSVVCEAPRPILVDHLDLRSSGYTTLVSLSLNALLAMDLERGATGTIVTANEGQLTCRSPADGQRTPLHL